jgi:Uma2 family endonuclease
MAAIERRYVTEAEFLALPDTGERLELFDGEIIVSASVLPRHQLILGWLNDELRAWSRTRPERPEVLFAPLDIRFGVDRILQPDLMVFPSAIPLDAARPILTMPLLVAEILSPSNADYDRIGKRLAYAAAGVPAYLVVDPEHELVEVFTGPGLRAREVVRDRLRVDVLPGADVDLDVVFGRHR